MTLQINDQWRIETDPMNYMIQKSRVAKEGKKAGETVWDTIGYYPTLEMAYKGLLRLDLAESDLKGIVAITQHLYKIHLDIRRSIQRLYENPELLEG